MRLHRIHLDAELRPERELALDAAAAHHVVSVLRHRRGERLIVFDGHGCEAEAEIVQAHRRHGCRVRIGIVRAVDRESPLRVTLLQALARGDKFDWVVQKATELGVAAIVPVLTERTEVQPSGGETRLERWREIARSACAQSGRNRLPRIDAPCALANLATPAGLALVLDPQAGERLRELPTTAHDITLLVGPEGGLDAAELLACRARGFVPVALGPRVLRTETAGLAALAILQALNGDL
ncbi:MAG: 16S rRNA (uracil(1498)-N(3))-methyltransferase [Wenzhouxiangellaceae bacterium]|nr:16S rRNA (uracil(1498)-N(3))-methyltransferase [Wenzhouxiangellaceae bacterium]